MRGKVGMARDCQWCGAPVPEWLPYEAAVTRPASQQEPKWFKALVALGQIVLVLLCVAALAGAIYAVVTAITERSPAQNSNYVSLGTLEDIAFGFCAFSAGCVAMLVWLGRNRRAIADSLGLLREAAAETAETARFCAWCGAPVIGQPPVAADPADDEPSDSVLIAAAGAAGSGFARARRRYVLVFLAYGLILATVWPSAPTIRTRPIRARRVQPAASAGLTPPKAVSTPARRWRAALCT